MHDSAQMTRTFSSERQAFSVERSVLTVWSSRRCTGTGVATRRSEAVLPCRPPGKTHS
ncbi:hypothetical protein ebA2210 [Aromatoleum aromaticum EbN1]|uniref:Uncharacterized protein n=1 Tax=Aromatoleum aromaticum (strain DSM 19018 / LMG 30748 / EbN1) TaxID=76114 RepID=Q5P5R7_AROAE|nr:hypothetical protein ebA2210 [Aromatoleum aromaticum EbN1]